MDIWKGNILTQWSLRIHGGAGSRIHTPSSQKPKFPDAQAPYIKWHGTVVLLIFPHFGARYDRPTISNKLADIIFLLLLSHVQLSVTSWMPGFSVLHYPLELACIFLYVHICILYIHIKYTGNSLAVQWLGLYTSTAGGTESVSPWLGNKEPTVYIQPLNFRHQISIFSFQGDPDTAAFFISHS